MQTNRECKFQEQVLEMTALPSGVSLAKKVRLKLHLKKCAPCLSHSTQFQSHWKSIFEPKEQKIADSLMRVYANLRQDQTLILKGWKLSSPPMKVSSSLMPKGFNYRMAIGFSVVVIAVVGAWATMRPFLRNSPTQVFALQAAPTQPAMQAKFKYTEKNRIQTHYLQPQLVRMVDFETAERR